MKKRILIAMGYVSLGLLAGIVLVSQFSSEQINKILAEEIGANNAPVKVDDKAKALNNAFVAVSEAVTQSVVSISAVTEKQSAHARSFFEFFNMDPRGEEEGDNKYRSEASGSGVIISEDGYIVTNNHVIENAIEDGITVTLHDRTVYKKAKLVGRDPLTDLAIIKIDAENLTASHFAEMNDIQVGDFVLAVGNPLGLHSTVTSGIISAIGRGQMGNYGKSRYSVEHYIQTDAAINPGNSGGGLFNLEGSLVGINTAIATKTGTYIGYGFAIPVDLTKAVINDLIEDGKIDRGYIGVSIRTVDETMAKAVGLDKNAGVVVHNILPDSPAEDAGIEMGDVILEVNGKSVATSNELQSRIVFYRAGDDIELTLWRDNKKIKKTVTLKAREDSEQEAVVADKKEDSDKSDEKSDFMNFDDLGFSVEKIDSETKESYDIKNGVVVKDVKRWTPAAEANLFPGAVIVKADRKKVTSPASLKSAIKKKKPGDAILLQVKYKDTYQIVAIAIPEK